MSVARLALIALLSVPPIPPLHAQAPPPSLDSLDAFIRHQMARRQVNGLSVAVIQDGRIVFAKGYGVADATTRTPVTATTLFQAGSISKPVAAMGALHLVEAGLHRRLFGSDPVGPIRRFEAPYSGRPGRTLVVYRMDVE